MPFFCQTTSQKEELNSYANSQTFQKKISIFEKSSQNAKKELHISHIFSCIYKNLIKNAGTKNKYMGKLNDIYGN